MIVLAYSEHAAAAPADQQQQEEQQQGQHEEEEEEEEEMQGAVLFFEQFDELEPATSSTPVVPVAFHQVRVCQRLSVCLALFLRTVSADCFYALFLRAVSATVCADYFC